MRVAVAARASLLVPVAVRQPAYDDAVLELKTLGEAAGRDAGAAAFRRSTAST
ncbi:MAG: hypothetical protein ACLR7Z_14220 [Bilophila wadsworthia]